jgi:hypothetical protein
MCGPAAQADISLGEQLLELRPLGGRGRIDIDNALVGVEGPPAGPAAHGVGQIELDDVGTEIGEDSSGESPELVRRVNNQNIREKCHR